MAAFGPEWAVLSKDLRIYWTDTAGRHGPHSLKIAHEGTHGSRWNDFSHLADRTLLSFSPQEQHLAIAYPGRLIALDLQHNRSQTWELGSERVVRLGWLDDQTVGYIAVMASKSDATTSYRQPVGGEHAGRVATDVQANLKNAVEATSLVAALYAGQSASDLTIVMTDADGQIVKGRDGRVLMKLGSVSDGNSGWFLLPDGKQAVSVDSRNSIRYLAMPQNP